MTASINCAQSFSDATTPQAAQERAGNKEREKNNDKECEHEL